MAGSVAEVRSVVAALEQAAQRRLGEAEHIRREMEEVRREVEGLAERQAVLEEAIAALQTVADVRQDRLQQAITRLVTHGLRVVFGDPGISCEMRIGKKGAYQTVEFVVRSGEVETPVIHSRGGGLSAVVGFLLRLLLVVLSDRRKVLFLDETFAQLSAEYEPVLADLLRYLVDTIGVQIVMVTHSDAYAPVADVVYRFRRADGETYVERVGERQGVR